MFSLPSQVAKQHLLLDLVKKAPKDEFVIVFGDTQMEFPDTYEVVNKIEAQCKAKGIKFYRAKSDLGVGELWKFAPRLGFCAGVVMFTKATSNRTRRF